MVLIETGILFQHCQTFMNKLQAVLEISNIFVQGGGYTCTLSLPSLMGQVLSEERASYNSLELKTWVEIIQVGILWVEIFREGIFRGEFDGWEFSRGEFS